MDFRQNVSAVAEKNEIYYRIPITFTESGPQVVGKSFCLQKQNSVKDILAQQKYILYTRKYSPSSFIAREFKTGKIPMSQIISLQTQLHVSEQIQDGAKMVARLIGGKLHCTKIALYTVSIKIRT